MPVRAGSRSSCAARGEALWHRSSGAGQNSCRKNKTKQKGFSATACFPLSLPVLWGAEESTSLAVSCGAASCMSFLTGHASQQAFVIGRGEEEECLLGINDGVAPPLPVLHHVHPRSISLILLLMGCCDCFCPLPLCSSCPALFSMLTASKGADGAVRGKEERQAHA